MAVNRRDFLRSSALGAAAFFANWKGLRSFDMMNAMADTTSGYKALVCIFLFGGNDSNNMILPLTTNAQWTNYQAARKGSSIYLDPSATPSQITPLTLAGAPTEYGVNWNMSNFPALFDAGHAAVLFNVGPMLNTKYVQNSTANAPLNLMSHVDQQNEWQTAVVTGPNPSGWGGRISDLSPVGAVPTLISVAGETIYTIGVTTQPYTITPTGPTALQDSGGNAGFLSQLLGVDTANQQLIAAQSGITTAALANYSTMNGALTKNQKTWTTAFPATSLGAQLQEVAQSIAANATLGLSRQIFFVALGGFDTHTDQFETQNPLLQQLDQALYAFYQATAQLNLQDSVTAFTMSDFTRTLKPANVDGSDHAWGGHHLIVGGAVKGGFYGSFPSLALGGVNDMTNPGEGRWIPTTSMDQYAATLATWYGISQTDLTGTVLPNLQTFLSAGWNPPPFL